MKVIVSKQGSEILVDDSDFDNLSRFQWNTNSRGGYATRHRVKADGPGTFMIKMHREIAGSTQGMMVDHVNRNPRDNQRENLRLCTASENQYNKLVQPNSASGVKGVRFSVKDNRWIARIKTKGKHLWIGQFLTKEAAALAYQKKALEVHGEFARF